jgi:hypothetical protein
LNLPNTPGVIGGAASGVCQSSGVVYTIASVPNATSYSWTVPAGATIAAGQGTAALTVDFGAGFTGGQITVASVNGCGTSSVRSFTVSGAPARPGAISGIVSPACGGQSYTYSVGSVAGTTNYLWTVTPGGSVAFPTPLIVNGKDAQITWTLGAPSSQGVNVRTQNACGTSTTRSASVTVNTCIRVADAIQAEIYPNPAHDLVNVVFAAESAANFQVQIIDAAGRVVAQESIAAVAGMNKMEVDVNGLASGMYTIMISNENSKLIEKLLID